MTRRTLPPKADLRHLRKEAKKLHARLKRRVSRPAVYMALRRLESRRLLSSHLGEATPERGGRAKRFFGVTPRGVRAARDTQQALVALWRDVPQLKERHT